MTWRSLGTLMILGTSIALLTGCGKETSSAAPTSVGGAAPRQSTASITPEQRQKIIEAGKNHQAGGRARAHAMQQTRTQP